MFAFPKQPVEDQHYDDEEEWCSSHSQVVEANFEHVLVRLGLDDFGAFDGLLLPDPIVSERLHSGYDLSAYREDVVPIY